MTDDLVTWLRQQLDDEQGKTYAHCDGCEGDSGCDIDEARRRMLAEVDAKRQRIEHYLKVRDFADPAKHPDQAYVLAKGALERSLMLDALPYADRPGYRDEWRP